MSKRILADVCEDPECVFCSEDDVEAAFWDEFFYSEEVAESEKQGRKYTVKLVDEETGEESVFRNVVLEKKVRKLD